LPLACLLLALGLPACSDSGAGPGPGDGADGGQDDADGLDGGPDGADGLDGAGDDGVPDPCAGFVCEPGQRCEPDGLGGARCVNNTCGELDCAATEECRTTPNGGAECVDISCDADIDCPPERFCDGLVCRDDVCAAGQSRCAGDLLQGCSPSGSGFVSRYACDPDGAGGSQCLDDGAGSAFCSCEDDWNCPSWTACEAGACVGTGEEPTCRLTPQPFTHVLPVAEITWGGTADDPRAAGAPFPDASQVVMTPLVINLDDDTGDGLIDERDYPEILFVTFRGAGHEYTSNGVLRAIHGGGPAKGADYFAVCGATTWHEGDPLDLACAYADAELDATAIPAAGDLDGDGRPEIVAVGEGDEILIFSNTGERLVRHAAGGLGGANPAVALANLDGEGLAEIVIGRHVFSLQQDAGGALAVLDRFSGALANGTNGQGPVSCPVDLDGDGRMEIVAGSVAYAFPRPPPGLTRRDQCTGAEVDPEEVAFCAGQLLVRWDAQAVNGGVLPSREGFCAIADVWGADPDARPGPANPLDGRPEVVVVVAGRLVVLDGLSGALLLDSPGGAGNNGGAPNVDDFDGDGFPEVGTAFETAYVLFDLQPPTPACPAWPTPLVDGQPPPAENPARTPTGQACADDADCLPGEAVCNPRIGQCVCLHNGWSRATEDDSSRVTGSSVFDFNGDGAAEVIYNDECRFRIYAGLDGEVYFSEPSESRTRIEYPVVADVDNDGNAEIVFGTSNESGFCSENLDAQYNNGLEVWGDRGDFWVSARRVWNQHAYHVTNVLESGGLPTREPPSWRPYGNRVYNNYRSNPRAYDSAPDLAALAMQFSSPDAACGALSTTLDIVVQVENRGDLQVGPDLALRFEGRWSDPELTEELLDPAGDPLEVRLGSTLEPGGQRFVSARFEASSNPRGTLPGEVRALIDPDNLERECVEDNNDLVAAVSPGVQTADLRLELGAIDNQACPRPTVAVEVWNEGSLPAADFLVRFFVGDPAQGGALIKDEPVAGPLAPGASLALVVTLEPIPMRPFTLHAVVDPDDRVAECDEGDNRAAGGTVTCWEQ